MAEMTPQDEPVAWIGFSAIDRNKRVLILADEPKSDACSPWSPLYTQSPAAVRAAAIAECLQIVRDEFVGDGGRLNDQQEGYNDAVYQIEKRLSALSPRPQVSEEWIREQAFETLGNPELVERHKLMELSDAIRAALAALGYEVTK